MRDPLPLVVSVLLLEETQLLLLSSHSMAWSSSQGVCANVHVLGAVCRWVILLDGACVVVWAGLQEGWLQVLVV